MLFSPLPGAPLGYGVEILAISVENHLVEILGPILAEGTVLIKAGAVHLRDPCSLIALEPVELNEVRAELALGDKRLNGGQKQCAVRFGDNANAAFSGASKDVSEFGLGARVEMDLR